MLYTTTFREWLIEEQWRKLFETILLETDAFDAAMAANNMQFNQALGVRKNWFGMIIGQANHYAKGMDVLTVASETATEMLMALHDKNPNDPFWKGIEQILAIPDQNQRENGLAAFFTNAAMLRARRYAGQYHRKRDKLTYHMSDLDNEDRGKRGGMGGIMDPHAEDPSEGGSPEDRMDSMRRAVMMELERMKAGAKDKRARERLELAKQVAEKRMENPPNFPSLEDLLGMFPDIKKTTMYHILQDVQTAAERAADHVGIDTAGMRRRQG